jgi:hypothetical protein
MSMDDGVWTAVLDRARGEVREGRALSALLEDELAPEEREGLRQVGLVVLRPDSLAAGQGAAILAHLAEDLHLEPLALRVHATLSPALVDATYHRQPKISRSTVWLQHQALGSGPAAAALVASAEPREPDLCSWLYACKGSLRELFGRTSSLHAVVHIPEDVPAFAAEASLFFPWQTIREAAGARRAAIPARFAADLVTLEPGAGRLVFQAALKVKRRIAAALALRVPNAGWLERLWRLTVDADAGLDGKDYLGQRSAMLVFAEEERELLETAIGDLEGRLAVAAAPPSGTRARRWRALRDAVAPLELASASWFLSGHESYGGDGGERLFAALAEHDVPLSVQQRALLAAALHHDLHPGARVDGQRVWPLGADPGGAFG